jgi:hypothetical protein
MRHPDPPPQPPPVDPFDAAFEEEFSAFPSQGPSARCSEQIRKRCTQGLKAKQPWSRAQRVRIATFVCLGMSLALAVALWHSHSTSWFKILVAGAWLAIVPLTLALGVGDCRHETRTRRWAWVLLVPVTFYIYLVASSDSRLPFTHFLTDASARSAALMCGSIAFFTGVGTFAAILHLWRRTDPFNPQLSGALIGVVGGLSGAVASGLMCPITESWHLLLSHGCVVIALTVAGVFIGRRIVCP